MAERTRLQSSRCSVCRGEVETRWYLNVLVASCDECGELLVLVYLLPRCGIGFQRTLEGGEIGLFTVDRERT